MVKHLPAMRETQVQSLGREDPLEKEMATYSSILQDGARHYYWIVKNLFCFCVKGRSFQGVNVSELEFIWK